MYFLNKIFLSLLLPLSVLPRTVVAQSCSTFSLTSPKDGYTRPTDGATRVSRGVVCPAAPNTTCGQLPGQGYVAVHNVQNVTLSSRERGVLSDTIGTSINTSTLIGWVDGVSYNVGAGMSGFVAFTPTLRCWTGVLSGCATSTNDNNNNHRNGTFVEACTPDGVSWDQDKVNGAYLIGGTFTFVTTDPQTAANMTSNPALQLPPSMAGRVAALNVLWMFSLVGMGVWLLL